MLPFIHKQIKIYDFPHPLCFGDYRSNLRTFSMVRLACVSALELALGNPPSQTTRLKFMLSAHLRHEGDSIAKSGNEDKILKRFGNSRLIKRSDGKYELVGGNENNFSEAKEWVSLFAHEIVFKRSLRYQHIGI
jgi:hypothetical protein